MEVNLIFGLCVVCGVLKCNRVIGIELIIERKICESIEYGELVYLDWGVF